MPNLDPTIFAAAIVTVIAALTGGIVQIFNAMSATADRREARRERELLSITSKATEKKTDNLIEKTAEIHTLANSNLSRMTAALETANEKINGLEKLIAAMIVTKHDEASMRETHLIEVARALATPAPEGAGIEKLSEKLDENTVATDKNTAITKKIQ